MAITKLQKIKGSSNWLGLIVDIAMILLVVFDLLWLMFDALYAMEGVKSFIDHYFPAYEGIHRWFYVYDGIVVSIFVLEFFSRWAFAIYKKQYDKWFFFPFAHWYDILGCIPTGAFRILRLFRVIGLTLRLHKWGVIDLNEYYIYKVLLHYYNIIVEEIADRVVVKVLEETKEEMQRGTPLTDAIAENVIEPKKAAIVEWTTTHIQTGLQLKYSDYRSDIETYIQEIVDEAVRCNKEIKQIDKIPLLGGRIQHSLNSAISNIVFGVVDRLMLDLADPDRSSTISTMVDAIVDILLDDNHFDRASLPT
ncbi:MAG: ion transporter, partial [Aureispira sp.]|nr:ion transporter [Aureispira sp.]